MSRSVVQSPPDEMLLENEAIVVRASAVKTRPLEPVWNGVLWAGKPTLMAGDPGLGKSMLSCDIVARVTTGQAWPLRDEERAPGNVIMLSAEDDPEDTLVPRLMAAGADLDRVDFITGIKEYDGNGSPRKAIVSLEKHVELIRKVMRARGHCRLMTVDPLSAYLGRGVDSHRDADVRMVLASLAELAAEARAAVLAIAHLRKSDSTNVLYRVLGSLAFSAAARAVFAVVKDPNDDGNRLLLPCKVNIGKDRGFGFSYVVKANDDDVPYVEWSDAPELRDVEEILGQGTTSREAAKEERVDEVEDWLRAKLENGPVPAASMSQAAKESGYSDRDVKRAKANLKVRAETLGYQGKWHWRLPNAGAKSRG